MKSLALPMALLAILGGWFYKSNPVLFGTPTGQENTHKIFKHVADLDDELFELAGDLGSDFAAYRNHCLRVMTFTNYFLPPSVLQELPQAMDLAAMALAYHDIALWTDRQLNYLDPSSVLMEVSLRPKNVSLSDIRIMHEIILQHHKVTDYESTELSPAAVALVNAVRKADWADASYGVVRFGLPVGLLEAAYRELPEAGFHKVLAGMGSKLSPASFKGQLDVLKIFKW